MPPPEAEGSQPADELGLLMKRVQQEDQSALAELFERTHQVVHGKVRRIVRDEGTADDIVVETYAKVWEQAEKFDASRGSTQTWLMTLASRLAIDVLRKQAARPGDQSLSLESVGEAVTRDAEPSETLSQLESRNQIKAAVQALPSQQRIVIEASFYRGLSHPEIAELFGEALGTVKSRIRSGLLALRQALESGGVELS